MRTASILLFLLSFIGLSGCQTQSLNVAAVDSTFRRVAARHDKYVNDDASLSPLERQIYRQDTALLTKALDNAKGTAGPTTAPVK